MPILSFIAKEQGTNVLSRHRNTVWTLSKRNCISIGHCAKFYRHVQCPTVIWHPAIYIKSFAIPSFSCKALLSFDGLLEDELDDDFLLEECLEVILLDLDDNCSFLSCSVSLIQLWILFLNHIIFSSMSSNQSLSCSSISRGSKKLYSLCTSINILNTPSTWSICFLTASTFLNEYRSLSTALDFLSNLECSILLFF